jgi:hypothetical protein
MYSIGQAAINTGASWIGFIQNHKLVEHFVINIHAFHNAHCLRAAFECSLVVPILLYPLEVRKAKHTEISHGLRATQKAKLEAWAAQKKKEAITPADGTGSVIPKKQTRSEVDDTEVATQS